MTYDDLNKDQKQAFDDIYHWLLSPTKRTFKLFGYAGTGKTTLTRVLYNHLINEKKKNIAVATFAWKAAFVLLNKGVDASSIHSLIYQTFKKSDGSYHHRKKTKPMMEHYDLIIIDEGSMVPYKLRKDIESFNIPVLYIMDNFQLKPISSSDGDKKADEVFFCNPDFMLDKIMRNAEHSEIIQASMKIRNGEILRAEDFTSDVFILDTQAKINVALSDMSKYDMALSGTNNIRIDLISHIRKSKGYDINTLPNLNEPIITFNNSREFNVFNSEIFLSKADHSDLLLKPDKIRKMKVSRERTPDVEEDISFIFNRSLLINDSKFSSYPRWDYAYCLTTHKAQGSEWGTVLGFDQSNAWGDEAPHVAYTMMTRAKEKMFWVPSK